MKLAAFHLRNCTHSNIYELSDLIHVIQIDSCVVHCKNTSFFRYRASFSECSTQSGLEKVVFSSLDVAGPKKSAENCYAKSRLLNICSTELSITSFFFFLIQHTRHQLFRCNCHCSDHFNTVLCC